VTDPSHTLSDIKDEGDPAASRTTPPEHAPAAEPEPGPADEARETADNSSSAVTSDRGVDDPTITSTEPAVETTVARAVESTDEPAVEPRVMTPPFAALAFPEGEPQSLHPAHLRTQLIAHWITICVMSFGAFTIISSLTLAGKLHGIRLAVVPGLVVTGISLLAFWGWRYQHYEHARTSFVISGAGCEIRRGVLWRRIITVPLSRIQHTDVTQGPLQRAYGLATLTLYTAGTEHAKIDLNGLAFDTAMNIRQYLFERSEAHE
jgi:uncharacterized protein